MASDMSVVVGAHKVAGPEESQVRHQVESAVMHERYSGSTFKYDIMLLRLRTSIQFSDKVSPICVDGSVYPDNYMYDKCYVTGWGETAGKYPQYRIMIIANHINTVTV